MKKKAMVVVLMLVAEMVMARVDGEVGSEGTTAVWRQ
jgi:hypothetical protein